MLSLMLLCTIFGVMGAPHPREGSTGSLMEAFCPVKMIQSISKLWWAFWKTFQIDSQQSDEDSDQVGKYLLISSSGPAADSHSGKVAAGLYHLSEEMREGRSVYIQEHDTKYGPDLHKLYSDQGVWVVTNDGNERLRAATPSLSPTSVKWQYF